MTSQFSLHFWVLLIGRLASCHRQLRRQLAAVAASAGLNDTEFLLLCGCHFGCSTGHEPSQHELAGQIGLSASQASGVFESLRTAGLLTTTPSARDRRRQLWHITPSGQERVQLIFQRLAPVIEQWQRELSSSDQQFVLAALDQLTASSVNSTRDAQEAA